MQTSGPWRTAALLFAGLWLATLTWLAGEREWLVPEPLLVRGGEPPAREPRPVFRRSSFARLPGWHADDPRPALTAFARSCEVFAGTRERVPDAPPGATAGVDDWLAACDAVRNAARDSADAAPLATADAARAVFEAAFEPWSVADGRDRVGLFTGYYEPLLHGSRTRSERYRVPLLRHPGDIVRVDLGKFRDDLAGRSLAGRLAGNTLEPYHERSEIERGALAGRGLELLWVDDPIDAFFLHIQGSGRVALPDGTTLRVGYAGQNGHPYVAIGKELVARGALRREEVSMQSIRRWLEEHPAEAEAVLDANPSYVFFRLLEGEGPLGSLGVPLEPGRSLAVDPDFLPMGAPIYLEARVPAADEAAPDETLRRLLVAQDTGGAIQGVVRGDLFWGFGEEAASRAGRMKHPGRIWVLLPRRAG